MAADTTEEYTGPWAADTIICDRCGAKQVSVHPMCERVECRECHHLTQVPPHILDPIAQRYLDGE